MLEERTLAIVLRSRPHGESDKIVTFLTKDWGKVTGIAKGAKRSQRRFVNVLEPFTHVQLRFRPSRTDELAFIFGCDLVQNFRSPSKELQRFALANYLCELIDAMVTGREADQDTYTLLLESLNLLEENSRLSPVFLPIFELLLLTRAGYAPHLTDCQQCGRDTSEGHPSWAFSPSNGGLLCAFCQEQDFSKGATIILSDHTVHFFAATKDRTLATVLSSTTPRQVAKELRALAGSMLARHLHRPLKSRAFLEHVQLPTDASVDALPGE